MAISPTTAVWAGSAVGSGMRPWLGFIPTSPVKAAGVRIEPPPSLAVAKGTSPAATAAADPPLDPPGVVARSHGLVVTPEVRSG